MSFTPTPARRGHHHASETVRPADEERQRQLRACGMDDETIQLGRELETLDLLDQLNRHGPASAISWSLPEGMAA